MRTVFKYKLEAVERPVAKMPEDARVLCVASQPDPEQTEAIYVWAMVDPEKPQRPYRFELVGTGHAIGPDIHEDSYVGSVHFKYAPLVFHVFQDKAFKPE